MKVDNKRGNAKHTGNTLQPVAQLSLAFNHSQLLTRSVNYTERSHLIIFLGDFAPVWTYTCVNYRHYVASFDSWRIVSIVARLTLVKLTLYSRRVYRFDFAYEKRTTFIWSSIFACRPSKWKYIRPGHFTFSKLKHSAKHLQYHR